MDNKILYLEIDEEITSVIDRLKKTAEAEIHLVVPKEAALLQSVVNLKLLKKQADGLGKKIQVITHDKVGRNLAEQVGIHSASRMGEEPKEPVRIKEEPEEIRYKEKEPVVEDTKEVVFKKGALLDAADKESEPVKEVPEEPKAAKSAEKAVEKKRTKDLLPKFPHKKFLIIAGVLGIVLLGFLYVFVPMTDVKLKVVAEKQGLKTDFTIDKDAKSINKDQAVVPGDLISTDKAVSKKYQATGKKDIGTKAQGSVTIHNTYSTVAQTLVAGTRFEANGLIFRTLSDVNVPGYTDSGGGNITAGTANVSVTADAPGDQYNVSSASFHIPAFAGTAKYDKITGSSASSMSGGSTKQVKVVTSSDVVNAKKTFTDDAKEEMKKEGADKIKKDETIDEKGQKITIGNLNVSKNANDEADEFTITADCSYKGLAYNKKDLADMAFENFKSKTGPGKQILEDKLESVDMAVNNVNLDKGIITGEASASLHLGTKLDENNVKKEIAGESRDKAKDYLGHLDGVNSVELNFFPSFLHRVSRLKSHIYLKAEFVEKQ